MSREWSIRRAREDDAAAVSKLLARAHDNDETGPPSVEEWRWLFVENPVDTPMQYFVADANGRLAGQYATLPIRLQILGRHATGLLSLNTATDPDFQRQGVFTSLAERLYEETAGTFALVFGFPNSRSAPGFYRRLGWHDLGRLNVLVRPLRRPSRGFSRRGVAAALSLASPPLRGLDRLRRTSIPVEELDAFDDWADAVWERTRPSLGTAVIRDVEYLRWRFDMAPHAYRRWVALGPAGEPIAYAVSRLVPWRGETIGYLMELQSPSATAALSLLQAVTSDARNGGAIALCTATARRQPHGRALQLFGFVPLSLGGARTVSFGARILTEGTPPEAVLTRDAWYLSPADFDWI